MTTWSENCGFGGKNKTQSFQKLFWGYLFVFVEYLCNRSPKIKTKNIKNYSSMSAIVNHRNWLDDSPPLIQGLPSAWRWKSKRERQACSGLISLVMQRGALVLRIAHGCPCYKDPAILHLFCKVPKVKNCLFPRKPLPPCGPLRFLQCGQKVCEVGEYLCLDKQRAASSKQHSPSLCIKDNRAYEREYKDICVRICHFLLKVSL